MSIGADLPPAPVQCPVCRRFYQVGEMQDVVAKATDQPVQAIVVCDGCYVKVARSGTILVMIGGQPWRIGLPEGGRVPSRR